MRKYFLEYFFPAFFYYSLLFIVFFTSVIKLSGNINDYYLNWDAFHYDLIRTQGYDITRCAFFPLFPFLWKYLTLSPIGISLFNGLIAVLALSILLFKNNTSFDKSIIIYSIPSFCFFFYPYTEALFFSFSTFLILFYQQRKFNYVYVMLLILSLIRPTISVLSIAYVLSIAFSYDKVKVKIERIVFGVIATGLGLIATFIIERSYTGIWDAFFISQKKWGNHLQFPEFPLRSWGGDIINRLDGVALMISCVAIGYILLNLYNSLIRNMRTNDNGILLSAFYLAGSGLLVLLYRNGELFSLNRFIFCTPFFILFILTIFEKFSMPTIKTIAYCFLVLSVYWLMFASFVHIKTIIKYELLSIFILSYFLINHSNKYIKYSSAFLIIGINSVFFLYFYFRIFTKDWVG